MRAGNVTVLGEFASDEDGYGVMSDSALPPFTTDEFFYATARRLSKACGKLESKTVNGDAPVDVELPAYLRQTAYEQTLWKLPPPVISALNFFPTSVLLVSPLPSGVWSAKRTWRWGAAAISNRGGSEMFGRRVFTGLALAGATFALSSTVSSAGGRASTEVIFDGIAYNGTTGRTEFNGRVESSRKDCANRRKITVYRAVNGEPDEKIGSKKAEKDGGTYRWFMTTGGQAQEGDYYAQAEAGDTCKGDKSNKVTWETRRAEERKPAKSKLTLRLEYIKATQTRIWSTRIKSEKEKCVPGRQMHVYQKVDGPDTELGQSTSDENGRGGVSNGGQPPFTAEESYYAKVPHKSNQCDAIKSKIVVGDNSPMRTSERKAGKAPAVITMDITDIGDTWAYGGKITSEKPKCKARKITVYRIKPGKDGKIGAGNSYPNFLEPSDPAYYWNVEDSKEPNGEYYALAEATNKCKKAKSLVIGVAPR